MCKQIIIHNALLIFYVLIFSILIFFNVKSVSEILVCFIWIGNDNLLIFPHVSFLFMLFHMIFLIKTNQFDFFKIVILAGNAILMCAVCYFIFYIIIVTLSNNFGHL